MPPAHKGLWVCQWPLRAVRHKGVTQHEMILAAVSVDSQKSLLSFPGTAMPVPGWLALSFILTLSCPESKGDVGCISQARGAYFQLTAH